MNPGRVATSVQINGPALRYVREGRNRTIGQLARCAQVSTSFLAAVERGARRGVGVDIYRVLITELELADPRVLLVNPYEANVPQATAPSWGQNGAIVIPSQRTDSTTAA